MTLTTLEVRHGLRIAAVGCLRSHPARINARMVGNAPPAARSVRVVCAQRRYTTGFCHDSVISSHSQ